MQIRMKVSISGTRNGEDWPAQGAVAELPDSEAADLVTAGLAEVVEVEVEVEVATVTPEAFAALLGAIAPNAAVAAPEKRARTRSKK